MTTPNPAEVSDEEKAKAVARVAELDVQRKEQNTLIDHVNRMYDLMYSTLNLHQLISAVVGDFSKHTYENVPVMERMISLQNSWLRTAYLILPEARKQSLLRAGAPRIANIAFKWLKSQGFTSDDRETRSISRLIDTLLERDGFDPSRKHPAILHVIRCLSSTTSKTSPLSTFSLAPLIQAVGALEWTIGSSPIPCPFSEDTWCEA